MSDSLLRTLLVLLGGFALLAFFAGVGRTGWLVDAASYGIAAALLVCALGTLYLLGRWLDRRQKRRKHETPTGRRR